MKPDKLCNFGKGPLGGKIMAFHCPACGYSHPFEIEAPNGNGWAWNGSMSEPTFTPSLLVHGPPRCHVYVTDGKIKFLSDCAHEFAGQTVDIPDWK